MDYESFNKAQGELEFFLKSLPDERKKILENLVSKSLSLFEDMEKSEQKKIKKEIKYLSLGASKDWARLVYLSTPLYLDFFSTTLCSSIKKDFLNYVHNKFLPEKIREENHSSDFLNGNNKATETFNGELTGEPFLKDREIFEKYLKQD